MPISEWSLHHQCELTATEPLAPVFAAQEKVLVNCVLAVALVPGPLNLSVLTVGCASHRLNSFCSYVSGTDVDVRPTDVACR